MSHQQQRSAIGGALAAFTLAAAALLAVLVAAIPAIDETKVQPVTETTVVTATISPPDTTDQWLHCYHDEDTERWVAGLAIPAPGECP